jgi:hypothetical protein
MIGHALLALGTLFMVFILFLVISKTMNNMVNQLLKVEYLFQKENDLKKEALQVRLIMEQQYKFQDNLNSFKRGPSTDNSKRGKKRDEN